MALSDLVDAYEHTIRATLVMAADLSPQRWMLPTWLPGWNVADNVAHIAALEHQFLGEDVSGHALRTFEHVSTPLQEHMERGIDVRRGWTQARIIDDLATALSARLAILRDPALTDDSLLPGLTGGERPAKSVLPIRVFDCWAHEQDIRAAVGLPGNLDSPAAGVSYEQMSRAAGAVAAAAELGEGAAVNIVVTGPLPSTFTIGSGVALATITTDGLGIFRLMAGRGPWADVAVSVAGDAALAERVLASMAITP